MEGVERALEVLASKAGRYNARVNFNNEVDYPLIVASSPTQLNEFVHFARELWPLRQ